MVQEQSESATAPRMEWIVFQQVDSYANPWDWSPSSVAGLSMPDASVTRYLYTPSGKEARQAYLAWIDDITLLTYTKTEEGGRELRLNNVYLANSSTVFAGDFTGAALKPGSTNKAQEPLISDE